MVDTRIQEGRRITQRYAGWAAGAGLIPLPFVDMAALMATQLAMVRSLARLYDVPFDQPKARAILTSMVASAAPRTIAVTGLPSLVKVIPIVGNTLGVIVMPALAVAATLGVGELFVRHFSGGGGLDDAAAGLRDQDGPAAPHPAPSTAEMTAGAAVETAPGPVPPEDMPAAPDPRSPPAEMAAPADASADIAEPPAAPDQDRAAPPARGRGGRRGAAPSQPVEE